MSLLSSPLRRLAAVALLAAVLVAGAAVVSASSSDPAPAPEAAADPQVTELLAGIPEEDGVLGDPAAPVTVTEYVDLQCPVCAEAAAATLPALIRDHVRTGEVKLELRTLHFLGPDSVRAAQVAAGAQAQDRLWPFVTAFYAAQGEENSGYVTDDFLRAVAGAAGVDADAALAHADTDRAQDALNRANADAETHGIAATPTFTVGDQVIQGHDAAALDAAIEAAR